ncbi:MAG TPA: ROK family protein [Bryobacteraceae bacterium]|nr:ROK family protein [Bryobacteraceae bacterium]
MRVLGGIEAGGSKCVCALGHAPDDLEVSEIATTTPEQTIGRVIEFFKVRRAVHAIGVASFGPVDLDPESATYGHITWTPKLAWRNFDIAGMIGRALHVPVAIDTDVNAAALAERRWGAAQGLADFLYITVGSGIGAGGMANGRLMHGRMHPEFGHVRVPHDWERDPFRGNCPYHGDCLEGLAAAPAIQARWGQDPACLPDNHRAWDLEARYLALGIVNAICVLSPQRVILGGGVMARAQLYPMIRGTVAELLNGYLDAPQIVPPSLGSRAGVLGAMALADAALGEAS